MIAALYVSRKGPYWDRPGVDAWDEERDARGYPGSYPVVAHPPCARWCRLAKFVESQTGHAVGDDGGCFASALANVRKWGGVLEHPAWSLAWAAHDLTAPPARGWHKDFDGGWCCEVAQSAYGHRAKKLTWLYYVGDCPPPALDWSKPNGSMVVGHAQRRGDGSIWRDNRKRMPKSEAMCTPEAFAELLISLAESSRR